MSVNKVRIFGDFEAAREGRPRFLGSPSQGLVVAHSDPGSLCFATMGCENERKDRAVLPKAPRSARIDQSGNRHLSKRIQTAWPPFCDHDGSRGHSFKI